MFKGRIFRVVAMACAMSVLMAVNVFASSGTLLNLGDVDFSIILTEVGEIVVLALPIIVSFVALRKGISFLKSLLRGA